MALVNAAQHQSNRGFLQLAAAKSNGLIRQAERIAHGTSSGSGQQFEGHGFGRQTLLNQHLGEVLVDRFRRHGSQIELQAA